MRNTHAKLGYIIILNTVYDVAPYELPMQTSSYCVPGWNEADNERYEESGRHMEFIFDEEDLSVYIVFGDDIRSRG